MSRGRARRVDRPTSVLKGYFADCSDTAAASRTAGVPEALFYQTSCRRPGVRTLDCVYAEVDPVTQHGVVITEDVAAQGAAFLDALSPYTADQVAESLEQFAILHGRSWESGRTDEPWLAPRLEMTMSARGLREISGNFEGPIGVRVPEEVRDAERLLDAVRRLAGAAGRRSSRDACSTVTHTSGTSSSMRPDNRASLDWQLVQRGPWYLDVGYHLGCTLSPEERRETESDLLAHYLDRLGGEGVAVPSWDDAMSHYRAWPAVRVLPLGDHAEGGPADHHRDARAARHGCRRPRGLFVGGRPDEPDPADRLLVARVPFKASQPLFFGGPRE